MKEQLIAHLDQHIIFLQAGFGGGTVRLDESDNQTVAGLQPELSGEDVGSFFGGNTQPGDFFGPVRVVFNNLYFYAPGRGRTG